MAGPDRIVLASSNPGKLREIRHMLAEFGLEVIPQAELSVAAPPETGSSFLENALLKARHACRQAGHPAIADDSGIVVDVLGGGPGVHSARFAGPEASDRDNLDRLLREVERLGAVRPAARFHCAMVYMDHPDEAIPLVAQATWEGCLLSEPRGSNGFGYDPVFYVPTHGCSSAELPPEVKNRISHRGQAMKELLAGLRRRRTLHPGPVLS